MCSTHQLGNNLPLTPPHSLRCPGVVERSPWLLLPIMLLQTSTPFCIQKGQWVTGTKCTTCNHLSHSACKRCQYFCRCMPMVCRSGWDHHLLLQISLGKVDILPKGSIIGLSPLFVIEVNFLMISDHSWEVYLNWRTKTSNRRWICISRALGNMLVPWTLSGISSGMTYSVVFS